MPALTFASSQLKVLVVEDDESFLAVVSRIFTRSGHIVSGANGGAAALLQFESGSWDLVLTDRDMPGMSGEALAQEIRKLSPATPILMMTGCPSETVCAAVNLVLAKPFTRAGLAVAVDSCLALRFDAIGLAGR